MRLARICAERGLPFVGFSSDLVFDGLARAAPYVESDRPNPLSVYGASKARAEAQILALGGRALMVRTAAFFSPYDPYNFASHVLRTLAAGQTFKAAQDLVISPTYVPDRVDAVLDLMIDGETGLRHLTNQTGAVSWADFARQVAGALDLDPGLVRGRPGGQLRLGGGAAGLCGADHRARAADHALSLENAIARYAAAMCARRSSQRRPRR